MAMLPYLPVEAQTHSHATGYGNRVLKPFMRITAELADQWPGAQRIGCCGCLVQQCRAPEVPESVAQLWIFSNRQ
jgi:hypothetical protein